VFVTSAGIDLARRGGQQMTHVPPLDPLAKSIADQKAAAPSGRVRRACRHAATTKQVSWTASSSSARPRCILPSRRARPRFRFGYPGQAPATRACAGPPAGRRTAPG
jgi:hypothetical protein